MLTQIENSVIQRVKEYRIKFNYSQADLADSIDVSTGFIGRVESMKYNSKYNLNHVNNIAKTFKISPRELLPEEYF